MTRHLIILVLIHLSAGPVLAQTALHSPWDTPVPAASDAAYLCVATAPLSPDIDATGYYTDAQHSRINPALQARNRASQAALDRVMRTVEAAADHYRATGSRTAARCAVDILAAQAQARALTGRMVSSQSYYVQHWALGALAIAYLKQRSSQMASPGEAKLITAWLAELAAQVRDNQDRHRLQPKNTDARNNHHYWAGMAVMAAGVAAEDQALYDWGAATYADGLSRVQPDGTLPLEMARGVRALHYHLFAAAPLVVMAEFGAANGRDFYAMQGGALHRLVDRSLSGLIDNSFFTKAAGVAQDTPGPKGVVSPDLLWAKPYARRFPSPAFDQLSAQLHFSPEPYLGGEPPP
jgi:poly(beta-D-mannuronate) lyase